MAFGNIYHFFHRSSQAIHKFYQHVFINITKQLIIFRNDIIIYTVKNAIHKIYQMIPASCKCIDKINAPMNLFLTIDLSLSDHALTFAPSIGDPSKHIDRHSV